MPLISEAGQKNRARGLLNKLKESGHPGRIIFFLDKKNFVVDPAFKSQNDRYICFYDSDSDSDSKDKEAEDAEDAAGGRGDVPAVAKYIARSKHPASAMFLGPLLQLERYLPSSLFGSPQALGLTQRPILRP